MKRNPDDVAAALAAFMNSLALCYDVEPSDRLGAYVPEDQWQQFNDIACHIAQEVREALGVEEERPCIDCYSTPPEPHSLTCSHK